MALKSQLSEHLARFPAPFLFVGAGLARRYLDLESWEELLERFAEVAGQPYEYYATSADGDLPRVASLIAADLHERWWKDADFSESRKRFGKDLTGSQSALKAEVSMCLNDSLESLPQSGVEADELTLLRKAVVDGVITTNYDPLLESVFPGFEVFVGQDQMLFARTQGIGEIYKIHGSHEAPDSLVLTEEDYRTFHERNPYLAAKLLTIFVEHPVIFLGYSLRDPNVTQILRSIASVLTTERIQELQDQLIFIEWDGAGKQSDLQAIPYVTDGYTIPLLSATVSDFVDVFEILGSLERKFPARVLRQLKERVYELVQTNDPSGKLYVQDIDADVDTADIDVVLGVGAIEKFAQTYKGVSRDNLVDDLLNNGDLVPRPVVGEVLPGFPKKQHVPIFKYLRGAGLLEDDGSLKDQASVDARIADRVKNVEAHFKPIQTLRKRAEEMVAGVTSFKKLVKDHDPVEVLEAVGALPVEKQAPNSLRRFLKENEPAADDIHFRNLWYRAMCLYDWLRYSRPTPLGLKPKRRPRKAKKVQA